MEKETGQAPRKDARLFVVLGIAALVLLVLLVGERSGLSGRLRKIGDSENKLGQAKDTIREHHEKLFPEKEPVTNTRLFAEKSLRTVVKEATEAVGIGGKLAQLSPDEDRKKGLVKARLQLSGVTLRNVVELLVELKGLSAGIRDSDARLRMAGYNVDRWDVTLTLVAPLPGEEKKP